MLHLASSIRRNSRPLRAPALAALLSACARTAVARDPIVTDRPDFTESTETVPAGMDQVEGGYTFARSSGVSIHALGEVLGRIATGERSELRLGLNSYTVQSTPGGWDGGTEDASVGVKVKLAKAAGQFELLRPNVALIALTSIPTGGAPSHQGAYQPGAKLALSWPVSERLGVSSNLNYTYTSADGARSHLFAASTSLGVSVSDRVGCYAEYFRFLPAAGADADFVNGGLTLLVHPDLQLDARAGVQLTGLDGYFVGVGVSSRW